MSGQGSCLGNYWWTMKQAKFFLADIITPELQQVFAIFQGTVFSFANIISFKKTWKLHKVGATVLYPFCIWENWGPRKLNILSKIIHLGNGRARMPYESTWFQYTDRFNIVYVLLPPTPQSSFKKTQANFKSQNKLVRKKINLSVHNIIILHFGFFSTSICILYFYDK